MVSIEPRAFTYLWNPPNNQLTPGQEIVAATVSVDVDSDFLLTAMFLSLYTGQFQFQVLDSFDYYLMSGWMYSNALSASEAYPTVFPVGHVFPAGSTIKINIRDLSEAINPLQLAFVGEKLFGVRHD